MFVVFFFFSLFPVSAQSAAEIDALLETEAVSIALASRFVMGAAGFGAVPEMAAYEQALSRGWVLGGPQDEINLKDTAFLVMNAFELSGGIMYSMFQNPRYAYREMISLGLIRGRSYENMKVSGWHLLQIIGRTLNYTGENE